VTGLRAVSGLSALWVLARNPGRKLSVALDLSCPNLTSADKAQTSLLRLAVASVTKKAVLRVRSANEHCDIGSNGGFMRYLRTTMRSHLGMSLWCIGLSNENPLHKEFKSLSCEISMPREAIKADKLDL